MTVTLRGGDMGLLHSLACRKLYSVTPECPLEDAISEMRDHEISSIFVIENDQLIGIITERDLVKAADLGRLNNGLTVKEIMTPKIISLPNNTLLDEALIAMESNGIRHLLVTDAGGSPLGVVTHTDIVRKLEEDFFKAPRPVREYMSKRLETVASQTALQKAISIMNEKRISCVIIAEGTNPIGIITERDIVKLIQQGIEFHVSVDQVMSSPVFQVHPDTSLYDASRIMEKHRIRHLIVWDGEVICGLITNTDVVRSIRDNYRSYLEKEAMRTRKILDLIHEGVVEISCQGYAIEWINQAGADMFGYKDIYQAIGSNFVDLIDQQDRTVILDDFANQRARKNFQCRICCQGQIIIMLLSYHKVRDEFTQRQSYRILLRDITSMVEDRKRMEEKLRKQKEQFQALFDNTTDAVAIFNRDKQVQMVNQKFLMMFGFTMDEVKDRYIHELVSAGHELDDLIASDVFRGETANRETYRYTKSGEKICVLLKGGPVIVDFEITGGYAVYSDITERKKMVHELRESEEKYRNLIQSMGEGMALLEMVTDTDGNIVDYRFLEANPAFETHTGVPNKNICGYLGSELLQMDVPLYLNECIAVSKTGAPLKIKTHLERLNKDVRLSIFSPRQGYIAILLEDMTKEKRKEERIQYLIYHDLLTGIHNRAFFEKELKRHDKKRHLPLTIVTADLNGLKLVNDAFGHYRGDQLIKLAAKAIKENCRDYDTVSRIGGDEFAILLPNTSFEEAVMRMKIFKQATDCLNIKGVALSVSFGLATKDTTDMNVSDVVQFSEVQMYNQKLMESHTTKHRLVTSLLKIMEEKTGETREHCHNVMELGVELGKAANLSEDELEKLKILALLHDIGNITIPEKIFKKPGALSEQEWEIVKKHPETGYRIVSTIPEFAFVAEYILCHHERIDGRGYPRGLAGDAIPKLSKILAIADAYEVMTRKTAYRGAMTSEEAKLELLRNAGTQFDSKLIEIFLGQVVNRL